MDYHSDKSKAILHVLKQAVDSVDLEKTAQAVEQDLSGLPDTAFADQAQRQYPTHSREATLLSALYAKTAGSVPDRVQHALNAAVKVWGLEHEVKQASSQLADFKTETNFLVNIDVEKLGHISHYAFNDGPSLKHALVRFYNDRAKFPRVVREKTAKDALRFLHQHGVADAPEHITEYLHKAANLGVPSIQKLCQAVLVRQADYRRKPDLSEKVASLHEAVRHLEEMGDDPDTCKLAVDLISAFDEETGYASTYRTKTALPEEYIVDHTMDKIAEATTGLVTLSNGKTIQVGDIDWTKVSEFDPVLAAEVGGDSAKAAEILPTWPRPDADTLVEMLGLQTV